MCSSPAPHQAVIRHFRGCKLGRKVACSYCIHNEARYLVVTFGHVRRVETSNKRYDQHHPDRASSSCSCWSRLRRAKGCPWTRQSRRECHHSRSQESPHLPASAVSSRIGCPFARRHRRTHSQRDARQEKRG